VGIFDKFLVFGDCFPGYGMDDWCPKMLKIHIQIALGGHDGTQYDEFIWHPPGRFFIVDFSLRNSTASDEIRLGL